MEKAVEIDSGNFKARVGLADLALREGKLALDTPARDAVMPFWAAVMRSVMRRT